MGGVLVGRRRGMLSWLRGLSDGMIVEDGIEKMMGMAGCTMLCGYRGDGGSFLED